MELMQVPPAGEHHQHLRIWSELGHEQNSDRYVALSRLVEETRSFVVSFAALCSDGSYSRFLITPKGECIQDQCRQFLEVGEDGSNLTGATAK